MPTASDMTDAIAKGIFIRVMSRGTVDKELYIRAVKHAIRRKDFRVPVEYLALSTGVRDVIEMPQPDGLTVAEMAAFSCIAEGAYREYKSRRGDMEEDRTCCVDVGPPMPREFVEGNGSSAEVEESFASFRKQNGIEESHIGYCDELNG